MQGPLQHCSYEGVNGIGPASALVATRSRRFAPEARRAGGSGPPRSCLGVRVGSPPAARARALAVDESGAVIDVSYRELTQYYPHPGWVEHDPAEIWDSVVVTVAEVA